MPRKPKVTKVGEVLPSTAVIKTQPKILKADELSLMVENLKAKILFNGYSLDEALRSEDLSRASMPVAAYKALLRESLTAKIELYDLPPDQRSRFVRAADFETYMKAVDRGDTDTQATFSKILRQDSELAMETKAPTIMVNLGALKDILAPVQNVQPPQISSEIIDAEIITPDENAKIKEST